MKHLLKITSAVLVLLLCALGGVFLWRSGFFAALSSQQALQDYISQFAPYSHLCFFLLQFLSVVLAPIPSNLSAAAGGMLFGTWPSFFLTIAAVLSASLLVFLLARALGQPFADRLVSRAISDKYLSSSGQNRHFPHLGLSLPFFPDDLLCILAGLTAISTPRFLVIVVLTRPWGLLVASALGGATLTLPLWAMVLLGIIGVAVFLLGMKYGDRWEESILKKFRHTKEDSSRP